MTWHLPLVPVVIPGLRSPCGPCVRAGALAPAGGSHARCTCGAMSDHLRWRQRRAWHREHRQVWRAEVEVIVLLWILCMCGIHLKRDIPARGTAHDDGSYAPVTRCAICKTKI